MEKELGVCPFCSSATHKEREAEATEYIQKNHQTRREAAIFKYALTAIAKLDPKESEASLVAQTALEEMVSERE